MNVNDKAKLNVQIKCSDYKRAAKGFKLFVPLLVFFLLSNCLNNSGPKKHETIQTTKIALLLPLESKSEKTNILSNDLVNSARLAAQDLANLNLVLSVYPTSGDKKRAAHAAKAAVQAGAQIIIGPLFSEETDAVKAVLDNDQTKIISLSNDPRVTGKNVFIMGTTFETSANRLVTFALSRGLKRIAIIGPKENFGRNGIEAIKDAIKRNGAVLTATASYPFSLEGIKKSAPQIYADLKLSKSTAVIFTDSPTRGLGFMTEQLSQLYNNASEKQPQFMGLTRWDNTKKILRESSLQEAWFVIPDQQFKKKYKDRYSKIFGVEPSNTSWLTYDAIALVGGVLNKNKFKNDLNKFQKKYFLDQNGFVGINGIFRFKADGSNERSLSIAEVDSGKFKIIDPAKNKFQNE